MLLYSKYNFCHAGVDIRLGLPLFMVHFLPLLAYADPYQVNLKTTLVGQPTCVLPPAGSSDSLRPPPLPPLQVQELISDISQGGSNNCASIVLLKSAIATFGADCVFTEMTDIKIGNVPYLHIVMRDGHSYNISQQELIKVEQYTNFKIADPTSQVQQLLKRWMNLFSAVIFTREMEVHKSENHYATWDMSAATVTDGAHFLRVPRFLGLDKYVICGPRYWHPGAVRFLKSQKAGFAESPKHVRFSYQGVVDEYGTPSDIKWTVWSAIALSATEVVQPPKCLLPE